MWKRILWWLRRADEEQDLHEELQSHIALEARQNQEAGAAPREAKLEALRALGNPTRIAEQVQDVWRFAWLDELFRDLRYGVRSLRHNPGFAAVAILTLALGIGATTAVYSIVDAVLLRPLPYKDADRLVAIWGHSTRDPNLAKVFLSYADFDEFRRKATTLEQVSAATWFGPLASHILSGNGPARVLTAIPVSGSFFDLLGVTAARGRTFSPEDGTAGCVIVLAHSLWVSAFGSDPTVVGRPINLDQKPCAVVGIMPERFAFYPSQTQAWILMSPGPMPQIGVGIFARLRQGVTREQAQAETARLYAAQNPSNASRFEPQVLDLHGEFTFLAGRTLRTTLLVAFGAVGLLSLIVCLNVGNLLSGRMSQRQREMAVRAALGSGQGRLARQVLTESLLLSLAGTLPGVALAGAVIRYFQVASPIELTVGAALSLNSRVLLFTTGMAILTTLAFGLYPAWTEARANLMDRMKTGGRGTVGGRLGRFSITLQMGMSFVLLVTAVLLMQSSSSIASESLGFETADRASSRFTLPQPDYADDSQRITFYQRLEAELSRLPGVQELALVSRVPPDAGGIQQQVEIQGRVVDLASQAIDVGTDSVSPQFFSLMQVPVLRGRVFDSRDHQSTEPVAVINEALASEYFPQTDPVGQQIRLVNQAANSPSAWLKIIGVVGDVKQSALMNEMRWVVAPHLYRPVEQQPLASMNVLVRLGSSSAATAEGFKRITASLDTEVPFADLQPIELQVSGLLAYPRFRALVLSFFALSALLLSAVGLHGVLTQALVQRTAEFGVRRAVGARAIHILFLILRQAIFPVLGGLCGGMVLTFALRRLISSLLYGSGSLDVAGLAGAAFTLVAAATLAIVRPAMRAVRVDPVEALRQN